jgi:ribosome-associated protein
MGNIAGNSKKQAVMAARLADDRKAENIRVYYIAENSSLADYVVIATADSTAQLEAIEDGISRTLKDDGVFRLHSDGHGSDAWRVLDYGGMMVHVATPEAREFYALDKIYHFGKEVHWQPRVTAAAGKSPRGVRAKRAVKGKGKE